MQVIGFRSNHSSAGDVLFNESIGGDIRYWDSDGCVYDSDSGKYYPTLFELEESFWASKYYSHDSPLPEPMTYTPYQFSVLLPTFESYEVPLIGIEYELVYAQIGYGFQSTQINGL